MLRAPMPLPLPRPRSSQPAKAAASTNSTKSVASSRTFGMFPVTQSVTGTGYPVFAYFTVPPRAHVSAAAAFQHNAHTLRTPKHRSHYLLLFNTTRDHIPDPQAQLHRSISPWTEVWPTQPVLTCFRCSMVARPVRYGRRNKRQTYLTCFRCCLFINTTRNLRPPSTGAFCCCSIQRVYSPDPQAHGATITMDGGVADTARGNIGR